MSLFWVHFHGLPMEYWDEEVFEAVASDFQLISIAYMTLMRKNGVFSNLCLCGPGGKCGTPPLDTFYFILF